MTMNTPQTSLILTGALFLGMLLFMEIGRRVGARRHALDPEGAKTGVSSIEGAIYALLGLLVAFTFSGAAGRFDERRHLIVQEANDIGTAYLRLDLLPASSQGELKDLFRTYLKTRLEAYKSIPNLPEVYKKLDEANHLQGLIWAKAVPACQMQSQTSCSMLLLPALNAMFDITTTRTAGAKLHPPTIVFVMLFVLALACSFFAGFGMGAAKKRNVLYSLGFAFITSVTLYVILDIEYPRTGLIRIDQADQVLEQLLDSMK